MSTTCRQKIIVLSLLLCLAIIVVRSDGLELLTDKNFEELTKNRSIMIRFITDCMFRPLSLSHTHTFWKWVDSFRCEECEETAAAWEQLSKEWEEHSIGFVAEVKCDSVDAEILCDSYEVAGYPSVYFGDADSPELYRGKLDYDSLSKFAKDNISKMPCNVKNFDVCDDNVKSIITKLRGKTQEELEKLEQEVIKKVGSEQSKFDRDALELQKKYQAMANAFNSKVDKLRDESGFKWIQQLLNEIEEANDVQDEYDSDHDEL